MTSRTGAFTAGEALARALIAAAPDALLAIGPDGTVAEFNHAAQRLLGWPREVVLGADAVDLLIPARDRAQVRAGLAALQDPASDAAALAGQRITLTCADGTEQVVDLTRFRLDLGTAIYIGVFLRDAGNGEPAPWQPADGASHQRPDANPRLHEFDELKTRFLGTLSHELRSPLASIMSFASLVLAQESALSADSAEFLRIIERNVEQLLRLLEQLLLLSRLEAGFITLKLADVPVAELVRAAVAAVSASAAARDVTLTGVAPAGPPMLADRHRLREVLDNLISNAVKFTAPGGKVSVLAARDRGFWRITVQDEGIGIPADELDKLFGQFYRASNARTSGASGAGVGLAIVKTITEMHGGHVEVQSTVGSGTAFSVFIPESS